MKNCKIAREISGSAFPSHPNLARQRLMRGFGGARRLRRRQHKLLDITLCKRSTQLDSASAKRWMLSIPTRWENATAWCLFQPEFRTNPEFNQILYHIVADQTGKGGEKIWIMIYGAVSLAALHEWNEEGKTVPELEKASRPPSFSSSFVDS